MAFNWTCPYCVKPQTVTDLNCSIGSMHFYVVEPDIGHTGLRGQAIVCSNPECQKITVAVGIVKAGRHASGSAYFPAGEDVILNKRLLPESMAKPQPEYIPPVILEDYYEACKISNLSPKASATLSRRCLQGMIRDFCGIQKRNLNDEILELKKMVDKGSAPKGVSDDSVEAIDAIRKIGNIGAHMEKDINLIINVEPEEANILIEIIETLFDEWYIEREKRRIRFSKIKEISAANDEKKGIAQKKPVQIEALNNQETD